MELANGKVNKFFTLPDKGENRYYIDDFDADEDKYNNNVYLLSQHIPEKSVVLDIGCGSGKFGRKLKEKECTVYGLERDSKAAEYAMKTGCYKNVFECDITEKDCNAYREFLEIAKDIDIIILSDILEHLEEPTQLLVQCNDLLKENGHILVSIPNIAHMDISLNLLNGRFNYTDMGILDNTHLKFFTKTSFFEWINLMNESFSEINFDAEYLGGTFYNNEFLNRVKEEYKELYEVLQYSTTYNTFQLLFKLSKLPKGQQPIKTQSAVADKTNDVVDILGKRLKGEVGEITNIPALLKGERLEYEQQVKSLSESVCKQQEYISNLENSMNEQKKYIAAVDESLAWYKENDLAKSAQIENQANYEEVLEKSINWYKESIQDKEKQVEEQLNYIKVLKESVQWYEEHVESANNQRLENEKYIAALKESIKWYEEQAKCTDNEKLEREKYIQALEESIKWHETYKEDIQKQLEDRDKIIEQISLEKQEEVAKVKNENMALSEKIVQIEKSIYFKMYKFFNKN